MTEGTLHRTPRTRDVVREQIRIVGLSLRREALVVAVVLGIVTVTIAVAIVRGEAESWFDSDEWFMVGVVAFLCPFAIWRSERPFAPSFFWTLPVERGRLALVRVFAGWVWLMAALAGFVAWNLVLALLSGVSGAETITPFVVIGATAAYLLGSAVVLGLRHPLRWLLGTVALLLLLGLANASVDRLLSGRPLASALHGAAGFWLALPAPAQWAITTFLWLGAGFAALWVAIRRHGERRRH